MEFRSRVVYRWHRFHWYCKFYRGKHKQHKYYWKLTDKWEYIKHIVQQNCMSDIQMLNN